MSISFEEIKKNISDYEKAEECRKNGLGLDLSDFSETIVLRRKNGACDCLTFIRIGGNRPILVVYVVFSGRRLRVDKSVREIKRCMDLVREVIDDVRSIREISVVFSRNISSSGVVNLRKKVRRRLGRIMLYARSSCFRLSDTRYIARLLRSQSRHK